MTPKATPENSKYNRKRVVKNGSGEKAIETARKKYAKHADKPTTAAADPNLRLPEALQQVDPQKISQVLPEMYNKLMSVRNLLNILNSKNSSSSGQPNSYAQKIIIDAFTGALCIIVKENGYYNTLLALFKALENDQYKEISDEFQTIVFEAIIALIVKAEDYGEEDIPVSSIPEITSGSNVPTPLYTDIEEIPDYYVQQYYTEDLDPYLGYIQYKNSDGDYAYLRRTTHPHYTSAEEEIRTVSEYQLAEELNPYILDNNLTITILNALLSQYCTSMQNDHTEKTAGKNSSNNLLSMLSQLAGIAGTMASLTQSNHLPQSVLDVGSMSTTLDNHKKNIGKLMMMKSMSSGAFNPSMLLNNLGALSSLQSMLSSRSVSLSQVTQVASTVRGLIT